MKNRVLKNAYWIVGCRIAQSLISFVIGMITARYLGPSKYGLISYAASVVAFFQPIMKLGFDSTLVQEFINSPEEEGRILGTSLVFCIFSALVCIIGTVSFAFFVNAGEADTVAVCFLYSLLLLFQACEMPQFWFQSKLLSKYPSIAMLIAYIGVSIYKIFILVSGKSVQWFAISHVIEVAIVALLLLVLYGKIGKQKMSFSFTLGKRMLQKSKYYIWSGLMVVLFQQTDRVMLKLMLGQTETGIYSAALTCVGITAFIFSAVIDSARPSILEGYKESGILFEKRMILLFSVITFMSFGQSLLMTLLAKPIIHILYGEAYVQSAGVLQVSVWFVAFGYYGMARNIWMLAEGKQKYLLGINVAGALMNVAANLLLIPVMGAQGAALASVITQFFTNFVLCFLVKPMRPVGRMIISSFNPKKLLEYMKEMKKA